MIQNELKENQEDSYWIRNKTLNLIKLVHFLDDLKLCIGEALKVLQLAAQL